MLGTREGLRNIFKNVDLAQVPLEPVSYDVLTDAHYAGGNMMPIPKRHGHLIDLFPPHGSHHVQTYSASDRRVSSVCQNREGRARNGEGARRQSDGLLCNGASPPAQVWRWLYHGPPRHQGLRPLREVGDKVLDKVRKEADRSGITFNSVTTHTEASSGIVEAAKKQQCDVIFMASHGRGSLSTLILGSVTQKVLARSRIPLLVYR